MAEKSQDKNLSFLENKKSFQGQYKRDFLSLLKHIQLPKIVSDLKLHIW